MPQDILAQLPQQLLNALVQGSIYALIALGYTMVYGVLRLINFAHGDVYMLGAMFGIYSARFLGRGNETANPLLTVAVFAIAIVGAALVGMLIERAAYRPLRQAPRLTVLIAAIGISLLLEYGGQLVFGTGKQGVRWLIPQTPVVNTPQFTVSTLQLVMIVLSLLCMAALHLLVQKTKMGRAMRAVSLDQKAASLMGININTVVAFTFALGSALAAVAGVLMAVYQPAIDPLVGINVGLKAFVAAVLGGIGNIPGAMLGGLLLGYAKMLVVLGGQSQYVDAISFAILIAVLLFRPAGILGKAVTEKV